MDAVSTAAARLSNDREYYYSCQAAADLDDHVTINGEHFKLLLGQYDITPIDSNTSKLTFTVNYPIITNMNVYAGFWGKWVMREFSHDVLQLYKNKPEK